MSNSADSSNGQDSFNQMSHSQHHPSPRFARQGGGAVMGKSRMATTTTATTTTTTMNGHSPSSPSNAPSRFLVTVLPPEHIPHDPPHPRTSTLCSGYGPPSKFRRGTLVPLYPTLAGQIGAIAREYGLPSTGGLVLYLVELNQEGVGSNSLNEALLGGPRIGNEAWQLLWGQLFEEELHNNSLNRRDINGSLAYSEDDEEGESTDATPELSESRPQAQPSSSSSSTILSGLPGAHQTAPAIDRDALSDVSSAADTSSALNSEDMSAQQNLSHFSASSFSATGISPFSSSARRFPTSSATTSNTTVDNTSYSSSPRLNPRSSLGSKGKSRQHLQQSLRNQPSRASNRSYATSLSDSSRREGPIYGESVIVGKLEFDIDSRRGGGRWFDAWKQSAETATTPPLGTPASQSSAARGYTRGGYAESQLGTLLKSRRQQPEHGNTILNQQFYQAPRSITSEASQEEQSQPTADPFTGHSSLSSGSPVGSQPAQLQRALSPAASRPNSMLTQSTSATADVSESSHTSGSNNRQSVASSASVEPAHAIPTEHTSSPVATSSSCPISEHSITANSVASASGRADWAVGGSDYAADQRMSTPRSPRSGTGEASQTAAAAYLEAANATPRVGGSQLFRARSPSPSPLLESGKYDHQQQHQRHASDVSAKSLAAVSSSADVPVATSSSLPENHRRSMASTASSSANPRQRVASNASTRSAASSASFEAVSDDQDDQEDEQHTGGYQALEDVDEDNYGEGEKVAEEAQSGPRASSPSKGSEYGVSTEPSEAALSPPVEDSEKDALSRDPLKDIFPSDAATWAELKATDTADDNSDMISASNPNIGSALPPSTSSSSNTTTATGLGIDEPTLRSPYLPVHGSTLPQSASSASFDPFEFDRDLGPTSPIPKEEDLQEDQDVEEVVDMLRAHSQARDYGLSSPINLGDTEQMPSPPQADAGEPVDYETQSHSKSQTGSPTASVYSKTHSQANSASSFHLQQSVSSQKAPSLSSVQAAAIATPLPESEAHTSLSSLPGSQSIDSIASSAYSHPSISIPEHHSFPMPPRGGNRGAGIPTNWASELSNTYGSIRTRTNSEVTDQEREARVNGDDKQEQLEVPVGESPRFVTETLGANGSTSSRNSIASLKAEVTRSRSSSVEMMYNLDEIERALEELSPRSRQGPNRTVLTPMPDFRPFFPSASPVDKSVAAIPGYQDHSDLEAEAPNTPIAASSPHPAEQEEPEQREEEEDVMEKTVVLAARPPRSASLHASAFNKVQDESKEVQQDETASPPPALPLKVRNKENGPLSPMSVASTTLPYDFPSPTISTPPVPQTQQVTFAEAPDASRLKQSSDSQSSRGTTDEDQPSSAKSTASSKFAGLRMKGWSGKSSKPASAEKDNATHLQLGSTLGLNAVPSEPVKSPLGSFKGFRFWQKEESADTTQKVAANVSLPMSPGPSQQQQQNGDSSQDAPQLPSPRSDTPRSGRIPRKSSLASLKNAMSRSDSAAGNSSINAISQFPLPSPAAGSSSSYSQAYPSPPTHTSLPSPAVPSTLENRSGGLPSFMPSYPPTFVPSEEDDIGPLDALPMMFRNDSSASLGNSRNGGSPRIYGQSAGLQASTSSSSFGNSRYARGDDNVPPRLDATPEMAAPSGGRFLGQEGQVSSAPVTPAYAEPSVISSSGRFGRPVKGNPARNQFRLSADADLTKMLSHMQAIEFGEDDTTAQFTEPKSQVPTASSLKGLGLGLPGARKNSTS